jgi:TonB-linked SusC/RagA family outer membrane protein
MKLTLTILLFSLAGVTASTYSQNTRLDISFENGSITELFHEIQKKSEFYFFYQKEDLSELNNVAVNAKDATVMEILDKVLDGKNMSYQIVDRYIVVRPVNDSFGDEILASVREMNSAQQRTVSGTVTDESGEPLPGVTVVVKGTTQGTVTNADGNYSLTNIPEDATLVFSFVGMRTQEIEVGNQNNIDVTMVVDAIGIEEVVAIGYGTRTVKDITGSVSAVNTEDIQDITAVSTGDILKGTMSGVTSLKPHTPGADPIIRIRGLGTINNSSPLWVVDGTPGADVNPNNIQSVTVLKDASAQAIYGSRGANGVILVTTKSGKKNQKVQINVNVKTGMSHFTSHFDDLNTEEFAEMLWLSAKNSGITNYSHPIFGDGDQPDFPEYILPARGQNVDHSEYDYQMPHEDGDATNQITKLAREGTDWLDVITRTAKYTDYSIDVTGGSENTLYSFMAGYMKEEGVQKFTSYDRINLRPNLTFEPTEWLTIGERVGITYSQSWGDLGNNRRNAPLGVAYRIQPWIPVYDIAGNYIGSQVPAGGNTGNPLGLLDRNKDDVTEQMRISGNTFIEINPIEGLTAKSLFGFSYSARNRIDYEFIDKSTAERGRTNFLNEGGRFIREWTWSNTIEYTKVFGEIHNFNILAGTEAIKNEAKWRDASIGGFFSTNLDYMQLDVGSSSMNLGGSMSDWSLFSYFGRINYDLSNKYLFTATFRRDGSSRFGEGNRFGNFPAFSLGWRISEENFMESLNDWLYLKFRGSWGQSGNDQIGNYNGFTTFASSLGGEFWNTYYPITGINAGTPTEGFASRTFGNLDVKWETTSTTNVGFDAVLFDRFNLSFDYWKRTTDDMLFPKAIPDVMGYASAPSVNVGTMENVGFDITIDYQGSGLSDDLTYEASLNVSHYQNEITKLSEQADEFISGGIDYASDITRAKAGTAFPEFYGLIMEGIFQTEEEAANHPVAFGGSYNKPGHVKYKDVNNDGIISNDDRTYIGSPHPDFTAGLFFNLRYKRLTFSSRFYAVYGNKIWNASRLHRDFWRDVSQKSKDRLYKSWGSPYLDNNENATLPIAEFDDTDSYRPSSQFLEDGSYLRLENVRIGYKLNELLQGGAIFKNLEIYGQVDNLFTITNYSGLDPEVAGSGINLGIDYSSVPQSRQYIFGINITL